MIIKEHTYIIEDFVHNKRIYLISLWYGRKNKSI